MAKMKAVQVSKANAPFEVVERDVPEPGEGQVRIRASASTTAQISAIWLRYPC